MIAPEMYAKETQLREIMQVQNMMTIYLEPFYSELQMLGHTAAKRQRSVAKSTAEQLGSILVNHSISTACTTARPRGVPEAPIHAAALQIRTGSIFKHRCSQFASFRR